MVSGMKRFIRSDSKGRVLKNQKTKTTPKESSDTVDYNNNNINSN